LAPITSFFRPAPDPEPPPPGSKARWGSITRGRRGGYARAAVLTPERRREIARTAAEARWRSTFRDECP
jgi:hypothetical protein